MATRAAGGEASTAAASSAATDALQTKPKLSFLDLPIETQREIISNCSQSDLICVALVSKHFHELASSQLYRNFHIIFPDDDDISFDSPIDGLAGGLDTFTTSDYNYAKHLRDLSMDTLSAGLKGESSYQSYLYSASCGKFLNTLLYLTLKKAKSLEVFRWNIRVELSRPVYRELHRIASLKKLHIRMQAGESYYIPPPPLPVSVDVHSVPGPSNHWTDIPPLPPSLSIPPPPGMTPPIISGPPPPFALPSKSLPKSKVSKRGPNAADPSTLSGFKNLKSLSVLDIDNLDIVPELNTCIRNSISTLTELQLSLSDSLANQARKPPPDSDADESDVDDEFQVIPVTQNSNNNNYDATGPAKAFRAQEERKIQETVLGKIFETLPVRREKSGNRSNDADDDSVPESKKETDKLPTDPGEHFFASIKDVSVRLMSLINGTRKFSASQQEILDAIEKAARKYVDSVESSTKDEPSSSSNKTYDTGQGNTEKLADREVAESSTSSGATEDKKTERSVSDVGVNTGSPPGPSSKRASKVENENSPDDIDIAHVEPIEDAFEEDDEKSSVVKGKAVEGGKSETEAEKPDPTEPVEQPTECVGNDSASKRKDGTSSVPQRVDFDDLMSRLDQCKDQARALSQRFEEMRLKGAAMEFAQIRDAEAHLRRFTQSTNEFQIQEQLIEKEIDDAERQIVALNASEELQRTMREYIRCTRGLALTSLSIHLIPIKASVLSRSINFECLKELTLLNVGNQAPFWTLLAKENKTQPLALRSIFTDNVSNAFLALASQLEELHELFLLERNVKHKPESFAPRTTTTMDQIRRLVLKKHIGTLKRLMIKDESSGTNWDANEKTMILICNRGRQLEELAVSMNIHAVHTFMQYFSGLVNLRAINILHFRNSDTCVWVVREILKFIVDNLSHHPELKLEWIAMEDDRVDRVVRPNEDSEEDAKDEPKKGNKDKGKKSKVPPIAATPGLHDTFPALSLSGLESESESDDDGFDPETRLRYKTVGPLQFYDVWGVKIFEKEIRSGKI